MGLATGEKSSGKLLYVLYVDSNTEIKHEITDTFLNKFILDPKLSDPFFTYNASTTRGSNIDILKNALSDEIINDVYVYLCPMKILGIPWKFKTTSHAYVVFQTQDIKEKKMWWSFEKNGEDIVLQQSPNEKDVTECIYDNTKTKNISRLKPVKEEIRAPAQGTLENLLRYFLNTGQFSLSYHLFLSNCWQFAKLIFEKLNTTGKEWTPPVGYKNLKVINPFSSTVIERSGLDAETVMNSIQTEDNNTIINTSLRLAIRDGNLNQLQTLLKNHPETIDNVDARGYTLIEWAQVFSEEAEKCLKDKNAKVQEDASSSQKNDKLFIALFGNETQQTKFITKESANAVNSLGETPLHLAAQLLSCTTKTFQKLLENTETENVNKIDKVGYTPLHWAFYFGSLKEIKMLIDKGADIEINVNDVNGESPLHLAVQRWGHAPREELKKIMELLAPKVITKKLLETKNRKGYTALHSALQLQSETFATFLLDQGDEFDIATKDDLTSFHLAVQWPDCPENLLSRIVLNSTKNLHAENKDGKTALHCALESQSSIACRMLLDMEDSGVNFATANGEIALHLAAKWSGIGDELFRTLLGKTTEINRPDSKGRTPLHCALLFKSVTATKFILLNKDATVDAKAQTYNEFTALHLAALWSDIVDHENLFEEILEKFKANLNEQDKYGRTALHCAILSKSETLIDKLLDANADATIHEKDGLTPLHLAANWRQPNVPDISTRLFNKILAKSSNHCSTSYSCSCIVNAKCSRGQTALDFALASHSEELINILQTPMGNQQ